MEIVQFVKLSEVDPIYYGVSYFAVAEQGGQRAYALIERAMADMGCAAIAKVTTHQREHDTHRQACSIVLDIRSGVC